MSNQVRFDKNRTFLIGTLLSLLLAQPLLASDEVEKGRYLVTIGGCNDCHTNNWLESGGQVAEDDWLTGTSIGWRGPWGTTYPSNLRLLANDLSEEAWTVMLHTRTNRPPMPWISVNRLSEEDARAIYRFVKSLGSRGERMPTALDAQTEPTTPYILLAPVFPTVNHQNAAD